MPFRAHIDMDVYQSAAPDQGCRVKVPPMLNHPTLTIGAAWCHGLTHPVLAPLRPRRGILQPCLGRHIDHVPRYLGTYLGTP
jgi:hypothetical protein